MTPAISGTNITLSFNDAGNYHGSDGNDGSYGASYKAEGNNITFGVTTFAGFEVQDTHRALLTNTRLILPCCSALRILK